MDLSVTIAFQMLVSTLRKKKSKVRDMSKYETDKIDEAEQKSNKGN